MKVWSSPYFHNLPNYLPKKTKRVYADDEMMAIDKSHMRRAILSRVCKQINHKYMNGINCIYLNYSRYNQQ